MMFAPSTAHVKKNQKLEYAWWVSGVMKILLYNIVLACTPNSLTGVGVHVENVCTFSPTPNLTKKMLLKYFTQNVFLQNSLIRSRLL